MWDGRARRTMPLFLCEIWSCSPPCPMPGGILEFSLTVLIPSTRDFFLMCPILDIVPLLWRNSINRFFYPHQERGRENSDSSFLFLHLLLPLATMMPGNTTNRTSSAVRKGETHVLCCLTECTRRMRGNIYNADLLAFDDAFPTPLRLVVSLRRIVSRRNGAF